METALVTRALPSSDVRKRRYEDDDTSSVNSEVSYADDDSEVEDYTADTELLPFEAAYHPETQALPNRLSEIMQTLDRAFIENAPESAEARRLHSKVHEAKDMPSAPSLKIAVVGASGSGQLFNIRKAWT